MISHDIAWAYHEPLGPRRAKTATLAPELFSDRADSPNKFSAKTLEYLIEVNSGIPAGNLTLDAVKATIKKHEKEEWFKANLSWEAFPGEVLVTISPGVVRRYYDPASAKDVKPGYSVQTSADLGLVRKQLLFKSDRSSSYRAARAESKVSSTTKLYPVINSINGRNGMRSIMKRFWIAVLGSGLAFVYLAGEVINHASTFGREGFVTGLFSKEPYAMAMSLTTGACIIVLSIITQRVLNKHRLIEKYLVESRKKSADLFENAPVAYHIVNTGGVIVNVNKAWLKLFGYKDKKDIKGRLIFDFLVPELRESAKERFFLRLQGVPESKLPRKADDRRYLRSDGTEIMADTENTIILDEKTGLPVGVQTSITDTTARKNAERKLSEERNLLRTLINHLPDLIFAKDRKGQFIVANPAVARLMGTEKPEDLLGKTDFDYYPPDRAARSHALEQELIDTGEPLISRDDLAHSKDGAQWLSSTKVPLRDEAGNVVGLVGIGRNITERKKAEDALRDSEEKYKQLFENAPVGYHEIDINGHITRVNGTELAMLGYAAEDMLGHDVWEFSAERDVSRKAVEAKLAAGKVSDRPFERTYRRKDGTAIVVLVTEHAMHDKDGNISGICTTLQDITERKKLEHELVDKNRELEELNVRDDLTGAYNRRFLDRDFPLLFSTFKRSGKPFTALMLDIDHFKDLNDRYGHQTGDQALRQVVNAIRRVVHRDTDLVIRYGGEEFLIVLYNLDAQAAEKMSQNILKEIRDMKERGADGVRDLNGNAIPMTASIGVAEYDGTDTKESLIDRADRALYEAKNSGRDRVAVGAYIASQTAESLPVPQPQAFEPLPEWKERVGSLRALTSAKTDGKPLVVPGSKILISENLLSPEDIFALRSQLNKDVIEIVPQEVILRMATNNAVSKETLGCIISREEFNSLWKDSHKMNNRSTVLVLDEDLKESRYLYLEGVIGLATAMMNGDALKVRAYTDLLFSAAVDERILELLKKDNPVEFALQAIFRFKPIKPISTKELMEYRKAMEGALAAA